MFLVACGAAPPSLPPLVVVKPPADVVPSAVLTEPPNFGEQCRDDRDCPTGPNPRYCFCAPGQRGGERTTGFCWNGPVAKDGRWWCTVEEGVALEMGVVFF